MGVLHCLLQPLATLTSYVYQTFNKPRFETPSPHDPGTVDSDFMLSAVAQFPHFPSPANAAASDHNDTPDSSIAALVIACTHKVPDQRVLANLLCTSKELRAAIRQSCTGCITAHLLPSTASKAKSFAIWLARNGHVLLSLSLDLSRVLDASAACNKQLAACLAAALHQAATQNLLQLRAFFAQDKFSSSAVVLQQLPCSSLTKLKLVATRDLVHNNLGQLTRLGNLRSLDFIVYDYLGDYRYSIAPQSPATLPGAFTALKQLTSLSLFGMGHKAAAVGLYPHLPTTLQELQLPWDDDWAPKPLNISQLSALTGLLYGYTLQDVDLLPSSLVKLTADDAASLQPLLGLKQLQLLTLTSCNLTAHQLQEIASNLRGLQAVQLAHKSPASINAAAGGWQYLPLHTLTLWLVETADGQGLETTSLQQLGRLQSLRFLGVSSLNMTINSSHREALAGALMQLAVTQGQYSTSGQGVSDSRQTEQQQQQQQQYPEWVLKLPPALASRYGFDLFLRSARASATQVGTAHCKSAGAAAAAASASWHKAVATAEAAAGTAPSIAADYSAATARAKLAGLSLEHCNLDDSSAAALLQACICLKGLKQLDLSWNSGVMDAILPVIAQELPGLVYLGLRYCNVSEQGVAELQAAMKGLQMVDARGCRGPTLTGQ